MTHSDDGREIRLTELHETTRRMMAAETVDAIANMALKAAVTLLDADSAAVYLDTDDGFDAIAVDNIPRPLEDDCRALAARAYDSDTPLRETLSLSPSARLETVALEIGSQGAILVGRDRAIGFSEHEVELLRILGTNTEVAFDRAIQLRRLRERESELVDERNRLAALFENIPSPTASFVIEDGNPVTESVNPAFEEVFGYSQAELEGEDIDDYIVPDGREPEAEEYNDLLQKGKNINVEVRRLTADGPREFLLDVVPFRLNEPNVHGYAMYTDITERKRREQELERQNERLEQFASIVSHDIRNPLNVAQGFVDVARDDPDPEYFDRIDTALDRANDIVESVLELARHGRTVSEPEPTSLAIAARDAWTNVAMGDAHLELEPGVDRDLYSDLTRLTTLFENLFRNSVEHGSTDNRDASRLDDAREHVGDGVTVTVGVLPDDSGFYVVDDGPGIEGTIHDRVFESGYTTRAEGTGFGLAIVKEVVDAHDWRIELGDQSHGARFEIRDVEWVDDPGE